jgi:hypothetical protein
MGHPHDSRTNRQVAPQDAADKKKGSLRIATAGETTKIVKGQVAAVNLDP